MAAPTIVAFGSGNNGGNSTTVSVTLPSNQQGDLLFVAIVQDGQPTSLAAAGWTPLYNVVDIQATAKMSVLYKTAGASEASPVTFTSDLAERMVWVAWSVRGHNGIHASAATPSTGSSATVSFPSISTSVADCRAFTVIGADNISLPHGVSTGYASVDTEELSSGGALSVASRALSSTGTESPSSVSITSEQWTSVTFAVAPSGPGSYNLALAATASTTTATPALAVARPLALAATAATATASITLSTAADIDTLRLPSGPLTRNPGNPLVDNAAGTYDGFKAGPRFILKAGATDYRMLYEAIADDGPLTNSAAYATSPDGTVWTKYAGNPVMTASQSWKGFEAAVTCFFWDEDVGASGKWVMIYHDGGNAPGQREIGVATADSLTGPWTPYASNPILSFGASGAWDGEFVADAKVVKVASGEYVMYYYGVPESGGGRIGRATAASVFGPWTKDASNPVLGYGTTGQWDAQSVGSPGVVYADGVWHLWYVGDNGSGGVDSAIGYAYSADGISWTRGPQNPVLVKQSPEYIGDTVNAYLDGNTYRVQYGRFDFSGSPAERQIAEATYTMATHRMSMIGWQAKLDSANIFFEPYSVKATNDQWKHFTLVFKDSSTRDLLYGTVEVPENYVGAPKLKIVWTSTVTTGNVVWDFVYRAVGGSNAESLDQSTAQESLTVTSAAPGAADRRMVSEMALTAANLAAGDTLEFAFGRDGADAADTLAGAVTVHAVLLEYSDS